MRYGIEINVLHRGTDVHAGLVPTVGASPLASMRRRLSGHLRLIELVTYMDAITTIEYSPTVLLDWSVPISAVGSSSQRGYFVS